MKGNHPSLSWADVKYSFIVCIEKWKGIMHHCHWEVRDVPLSLVWKGGRESSITFMERWKVFLYYLHWEVEWNHPHFSLRSGRCSLISCIERWEEIIHHFHSDVEGILLSDGSLQLLNANARGTPSTSPWKWWRIPFHLLKKDVGSPSVSQWKW